MRFLRGFRLSRRLADYIGAPGIAKEMRNRDFAEGLVKEDRETAF
jgi:hypothetical protein